ncbi:MAG: hypothetical protein ACM3TR_06900, partial [Caulobacteraceae bacterium]
MKYIYSEIDRITKFDLVDIYKKLIENLELFTRSSDDENCEKVIDEIKSYTLENLKARQLYFEDQPPLLYLKGVLGDM